MAVSWSAALGQQNEQSKGVAPKSGETPGAGRVETTAQNYPRLGLQVGSAILEEVNRFFVVSERALIQPSFVPARTSDDFGFHRPASLGFADESVSWDI
jgi:hypothetical protein